MSLRGEFPNRAAALLPGAYVRVQLVEGVDRQAITLPAQAVQRNNVGGAEVFIVNDQDVAVLVPVRIRRGVGTDLVVEDGLRPGFRVVVDGFQKITPGTVVRGVPWTPPSSQDAGSKDQP